MVGLSALWLPILLSAVVVFIVSSIIHMATPWHKGDYLKIPDEDKAMDALRPLAIPPGDYMVPRPSSVQELLDAVPVPARFGIERLEFVFELGDEHSRVG